MSATAVHFSMTAIRAARCCRMMISDATKRDTLIPLNNQVFTLLSINVDVEICVIVILR